MTTIIWGFIRRFGGWILAGVIAVALFFSVRNSARLSGVVAAEKYIGEQKRAIVDDVAEKAVVEAKVQRDVVERNLEIVKNVETKVLSIDDAAVFDGLRKYQRD
jgi:hypothetical protein